MQRTRLLFLARLGPPRRLGALVREARWLYSTYLGPLGRALFGGHPWRLHAEWRRLRPVLAGTVAAVLRAPGAVREARRAPSAAADRCARACRSARTIMAQSTSVMLSAVSPMQDVSGAFQGFVDYYDTERVAGWVFDGADPEQQLQVE